MRLPIPSSPRRTAVATVVALLALGVAGTSVAAGSTAASPRAVHHNAAYGFNRPYSIAAGAGHLWIANLGGNSVTETTYAGALVRTITGPSADLHSPDAVTTTSGHVFVVNRHGSVVELAGSSGAQIRVIRGARYHFSHPSALIAAGGNIWVVSSGTSTVTGFNATTGKLVRVLTGSAKKLDHPVALTAAGTHFWVLNGAGGAAGPQSGSVTEFVATTGAYVRNVDHAADQIITPKGIAFDGTHLWITDNMPGTVTELGPRGGLIRIVSDITAVSNTWLENGTVVVAHAGSVYVVSPPGASPMVTRLVAATAKGLWYECNTNAGHPHFLNPTGLAVHGQHVWVVSPADNTLTELHVGDGSLIQEWT
jgi:hypothetical protein